MMMKASLFVPWARYKYYFCPNVTSLWPTIPTSSLLPVTSRRSISTNRYIGYKSIIMIVVVFQLWLFIRVHILMIQQDTNPPLTTVTTSTFIDTSIRTPIRTENMTIEHMNDSGSGSDNDNSTIVMWPPMDMIHHIWDHVSTNSNDKVKRRLVVVASNEQYTDFAMNFAYSLIKQNVYNFVIVPLDELAYIKLHDTFPDHTLPIVQEFLTLYNTSTTDAASFGSNEFKVVTSTRPMFLKPFLLNNITIFYNDIDMVWQYNAWETIDRLLDKGNNYKEKDTNNRVATTITNQYYDVLLWNDGRRQLCTCMFYMVPSNISFTILDEWNNEIQRDVHVEDQRAFNTIYRQLKSSNSITIQNLVRIVINDEQFPTGGMYNWRRSQPQNDVSLTNSSSPNHNAIVIHNNWIVGKKQKTRRFKRANLWFVP